MAIARQREWVMFERVGVACHRMAVSLTAIPRQCPKVRQYQQTNPLSMLARAIVCPSVFQLFGPLVPNANTERSGEQTMASVTLNARTHRPVETNKCARCVVHAEYFRNVRAFLSTSHVHTAWTLGAHFTNKRARLSRTARAGLDRSHPLRHVGVTFVHTRSLLNAYAVRGMNNNNYWILTAIAKFTHILN